MTEREALDQIEIRHLIALYNVMGDRGRVDEMVTVFTPDARLRVFDTTVTGHAEIGRLLSGNPTSPRHAVTRHHLSTQLIEVDRDSASARTYFMVHTNIGPDHHGVYIDKLARAGGQWRITDRDVRLDWQAPDSVYEPMPVHRRGA